MNIMPDGTGWILPPRCAARYTLGLLWKYGVDPISYHAVNVEAEPSRVFCNVRNPYTRVRSWLRLWSSTIQTPVTAVDYIENLHTGKHGVDYVDFVGDDNGIDDPWTYVVPLEQYTNIVENMMGLKIEEYIRQECLTEDLERVGYPIQDYDYQGGHYFRIPQNEKDFQEFIKHQHFNEDKHWEPGDNMTDIEFYREYPHCAEIVSVYYAQDFERYGYSTDVEKLTEPGFCNPRQAEGGLPNEGR